MGKLFVSCLDYDEKLKDMDDLIEEIESAQNDPLPASKIHKELLSSANSSLSMTEQSLKSEKQRNKHSSSELEHLELQFTHTDTLHVPVKGKKKIRKASLSGTQSN